MVFVNRGHFWAGQGEVSDSRHNEKKRTSQTNEYYCLYTKVWERHQRQSAEGFRYNKTEQHNRVALLMIWAIDTQYEAIVEAHC